MSTCDNHPGVEAEHATCRLCLEDDDEREAKLVARAEKAEAKSHEWAVECGRVDELRVRAEAKVASLEARLAEVGAVVEAAERYVLTRHPDGSAGAGPICKAVDGHVALIAAVFALRAARAKREASGS